MSLIGAPRLAQAQLSESPIMPGFRSFANRKSEKTQDVVAACRTYIEIRFADGHYIGLRNYRLDSGVAMRERHRVPAIYPWREVTAAGGLLSYGPDLEDFARRTAPYVNRILYGENPADLPVQVPTKFQLVINLKTAKALGLTVSRDFLLVADEVIE